MTHPSLSTIFHITSEAEWSAARSDGEVPTSTRRRSLEDEGFIHCSRSDQVLGVANAVFADVDEPLVVLEIDVDQVRALLRYESPDEGGATFPHVYGPVPVSAVVTVTPLLRDPVGRLTLGHKVST